MKTVAEVLRGAVQVLDERGWTQEELADSDGRCCAEGAIRVAATGIPEGGCGFYEDAYALTHAALDELMHEVGVRVFEWNDADGRTVDEVKAALLAAAERTEAGA